MYTRNYDKVRRHTGGGLPMQKERDTELIIPREYHGEMLRAANRTYEESSGRDTDMSEMRVVPVPKEGYTDITEDTDQKTDEGDRGDAPRVVTAVEKNDENDAKDHGEEKEEHDSARGLAGGLFDLLLGKNSDEEETILLLGVALLLLSGHMDRGADGETWGEDDLALLLIGYLLLG